MKKAGFFRTLTSFALAAVMTVSLSADFSASAAPDAPGTMRDLSTAELVRDMGIGINLGNTYESCGDWIAQYGDGSVKSYVTAWGSPVITKEMIEGYKNEGFGVLRVPVAWSNLMGDNYTISPEYLASVREVVNWAMDCGLYVILNIHWDGGWFANFPTDKQNCMTKYTRIWTQLTEAFGDYSDYLMFESLNEEGCWDSVWNQYGGVTDKKAVAFNLLNEINQTFVDLVRNSGGNNAKRHLLIAGYGTSISLTCDALFQMPNDPAGRCAVSVHYYTPSPFAILEEDADWAAMRPSWGTDADFKELNSEMDKMKTNFADKGIPVIIGEYGCPKKNKDEASVKLYLSSVCKAAYDRQLCPVLWDVTGLHYDRSTCTMTDPALKALLTAIPDKKAGPLLGDLSLDGALNVADVIVLSRYLVNSMPMSAEQLALADVNSDALINGFDLVSLKALLLTAAA